MQDKLKQVIQKAIDSGWKDNPVIRELYFAEHSGNTILNMDGHMMLYHSDGHFFELLFDHDFAKAFFGEDEIPFENKIEDAANMMVTTGYAEAWKYHLQQAVLSESPLEYYYSQL